ncbi:p-type atpase protein [Rutstroemia sp. NJR-2017a BBW]|nr:p-type atpase protein [Rutstroemia sp. NJR-2017a BBW]
MAHSNGTPTGSRSRRRSSSVTNNGRRSYTQLYRRDSNVSTASFMDDVEMAQDEMFSGVVSESVPSSIASFAHRRSRADSTTSFTYYEDNDEDEEQLQTPEEDEDSAIIDDESVQYREEDSDLEVGELEMRRVSTSHSRNSVHDHLLRSDSARTDGSNFGRGHRTNQKIYIITEDLTIVVAGFRTSTFGYALYLMVCVLTLGLGYLVLRWLPKWHVRLVGVQSPLRECAWVVIEDHLASPAQISLQNQWGEFVVQDVESKEYGRSLSTVFGLSEKRHAMSYDYDDDPILEDLRILDYRYMRFSFNPLKDRFVLCNSWKDPAWTDVRSVRPGIDGDEKENRELVFGKNLIDIKQKSIPQLLVDEAFHPFYVFQIASLILWSMDQYYYYAACIFIISVVSITTTLIETRSTMKRLREISRFECDVRVLRNSFWRYVPSSELVPGDIYEVTDPGLGQFPCDSLLLAGDCIVNESMLTGESVPVSKVPASDESLRALNLAASSVAPELAKHFLFCGTKIIRARRPQDDTDGEAVGLAMAVRTGFNTTKGALVRSMLFPKPSGFKFYRDSFRYIAVMGGIAMLGFVASFINFVHLKLAWHLIIVRALDLITIVVPPALPATLTIGTNFALNRLKAKQIFCISPQRVNVGGKLDVMCFDKTGTLTEDGLDVLGIRVVHQPAKRFSDILPDAQSLLPGASYERDPTVDYNLHKATLYTMATCHSLRVVDGELMGDPLDLKMFDFTGWTFEEGQQKSGDVEDEEAGGLSPSIARPPVGMEYDLDDQNDTNKSPIELGVLKSFEFVSQLRRASVIVRNFGSQGCDVYVKGAPECMKDICRAESFPSDYEDLLAYYTHRGFRVIACATKHIKKLNWVKVQKMKREEAESGLDFLGFIIFENKLKPSTAGVLDELSEAGIRKVMCTGDNILTAISVARECNLIDRTAHCFVPHFMEGDSLDPKARLSWESIDNSIYKLDEHTLTPLPPPAEGDASLPYDISNLRNYSLAVSGDVFRWIVDFAPPIILQRVFARMSPDEKHELVEKLQSIDYCCGFCGDGANDCGALKAADVGISLSEAEASVAAPFTSRVFDITCVPEVIREGRAALVTSFSCFKYMSLYSAIQFTSVSFLYASASNLVSVQFKNLIKTVYLPAIVGWTGPFPTLCRKRPTANLVSRKVLTPLLGQITICILIQAVAFQAVRRQPWFIPPHLDKDKSNIENSENTTLFLVSCFEYILSGIVLSIGKPFRQSMAHNLPFVVTIVVALLFSSYMLFDPSEGLAKFMQLTQLTWDFKLFILALGIGYMALAWSSEKYILPKLGKYLGILKTTITRRPKQRKAYKLVLEELRHVDWILDGGYLPNSVIRFGIRRQLRERIELIKSTSLEEAYKSKMNYVELLRSRPIAIETTTANEQHYEVGTGVLAACLGPRMKYSCCLYPKGNETLGQAEVEMLGTYVKKAGLEDGMSILDLGTQKLYIDSKAKEKGLTNLTVITGNVVDYEFEKESFDRVVSIELFEHMKNYELLMAKVGRALKPGGKLFVHIFAHKTTPYDFEEGWMSTHFFSGGTMPSADLLLYFQKDLKLENQWWINGQHYAKTCEDWLSKMTASKDEIWPHLTETYGEKDTAMWYYRWQIFYMACAELFAFEGGDTWGVCHYLFEKPSSA